MGKIKMHIIIPGIIGLIGLVGIIILSILEHPVPDTLTLLVIAFGTWAFGAGSIQLQQSNGDHKNKNGENTKNE